MLYRDHLSYTYVVLRPSIFYLCCIETIYFIRMVYRDHPSYTYVVSRPSILYVLSRPSVLYLCYIETIYRIRMFDLDRLTYTYVLSRPSMVCVCYVETVYVHVCRDRLSHTYVFHCCPTRCPSGPRPRRVAAAVTWWRQRRG